MLCEMKISSYIIITDIELYIFGSNDIFHSVCNDKNKNMILKTTET